MTDLPKTHIEAIRQEFAKQAPAWGRDAIDSHLVWAVDRLDPKPSWAVLDVAAGSGLLARALAPRVGGVVAIDVTPEMLEQGRRRAQEQGLANIRFEEGVAERLPYRSGSFDMVVTRFSVHHFAEPAAALAEMTRVCRDGGRLGVIDIVSAEDRALALASNALERLRDPSHVRALDPVELRELIAGRGVRILGEYFRDVPNDLEAWLDRAQTPESARREIIRRFRDELAGGLSTGMRPFLEGDRLGFRHRWEVLVGIP